MLDIETDCSWHNIACDMVVCAGNGSGFLKVFDITTCIHRVALAVNCIPDEDRATSFYISNLEMLIGVGE